MSTTFPKYTAVTDPGTDRTTYTADRPWPDPARKTLRVTVHDADADTVWFDDSGRPSDVKTELTAEARQKIRARRGTPKSSEEPPDDPL